MLKSFKSFILQHALAGKGDKILLAVSGGVDSVVMCRLFHESGIAFGIAHCNFGLRGDESDEDDSFVEALAESYSVPFHAIAFDTASFAKKNKLSIQAAARELRYTWFEELRSSFGYSRIATAHHADDSMETFFMNLVRGTGIAGLHGILPLQQNIIRPMLFCSKDEIEAYAKKNKIRHRTDSSNASDKYMRNKIRNKIIPLLKELNPSLEETIGREIRQLADVELIYREQLEKQRKRIVKSGENGSRISIKELLKLPGAQTFLFEFLRPYHFNSTDTDRIFASLKGIPGKQFLSPTHRLIKDREELIIESSGQNKKKSEGPVKVSAKQKSVQIQEQTLRFSILAKAELPETKAPASAAFIDYDKLKFPLTLRRWEKGDSFYPLGMKGKKKLSDLFIDKKIPVSEKEKIWLLCSGDDIVWVVGLRPDERFKVSEATKKIYFAELL